MRGEFNDLAKLLIDQGARVWAGDKVRFSMRSFPGPTALVGMACACLRILQPKHGAKQQLSSCR